MTGSDHQRRRRFLPTGTLVLLVGIFVLAAAVFGLWTAASTKRREVQQSWDRTFGSKEELRRRYPSRGPSPGALEVERLAAALGIDVATRPFAGRTRPSEAQADAYHAVQPAIHRYLAGQLGRVGPPIATPPEPVVGFLEARAGELAALRRQLIDGDPPIWESDIGRLYEAPLPNLLGHINLQKLLITDALVHAGQGRHDIALEDLEASWRLNAAIRDDPILITQLIATSVARLQAGTLRFVEGASPVWHTRMGQDYRAALLEALRFEGWVWAQARGAPTTAASAAPLQRALSVVAGPYERLCMADLSERWHERVEKLSKLDYLCDRDLAREGADLDISVPRWNRLGPAVVPNIASAVDRVARLELDLELTAKILEAKRARVAGAGRWPDAAGGIERSATCPADGWLYESRPDGGMSLAFEREVGWPEQTGVVLPRRYESGPSD